MRDEERRYCSLRDAMNDTAADNERSCINNTRVQQFYTKSMQPFVSEHQCMLSFFISAPKILLWRVADGGGWWERARSEREERRGGNVFKPAAHGSILKDSLIQIQAHFDLLREVAGSVLHHRRVDWQQWNSSEQCWEDDFATSASWRRNVVLSVVALPLRRRRHIASFESQRVSWRWWQHQIT